MAHASSPHGLHSVVGDLDFGSQLARDGVQCLQRQVLATRAFRFGHDAANLHRFAPPNKHLRLRASAFSTETPPNFLTRIASTPSRSPLRAHASTNAPMPW